MFIHAKPVSWTQSKSLQWPHAQMYPRSCLSATAIHFPLIPTRIPHHSPAKGKVAVTADTTNCKEFTELSLPVKWAQPFLFPNHELSGQDFSGKRGKNGWIGQGVWQPFMAAGTHGKNQTAPAEPMRQIKRNGAVQLQHRKTEMVSSRSPQRKRREHLISMWLLWIWDEHCQMVRHVFQ